MLPFSESESEDIRASARVLFPESHMMRLIDEIKESPDGEYVRCKQHPATKIKADDPVGLLAHIATKHNDISYTSTMKDAYQYISEYDDAQRKAKSKNRAAGRTRDPEGKFN